MEWSIVNTGGYNAPKWRYIMEITSFWVILAMCLIPVIVAYIAVEVDEHDSYTGGWHKKHI